LAKAYQKGPSGKWLHTLVGSGKDYIQNPKPDGYRSIHLIFRYVGTAPNNAWDRLRVEMQLRSQHQHAWATALEAVDIFTKQALKANQGDVNW
jgi:ppGpp synthetase/RelA/SpoT-type nucleotidyltranferase